jgi:hypothetical protein
MKFCCCVSVEVKVLVVVGDKEAAAVIKTRIITILFS